MPVEIDLGDGVPVSSDNRIHHGGAQLTPHAIPADDEPRVLKHHGAVIIRVGGWVRAVLPLAGPVRRVVPVHPTMDVLVHTVNGVRVVRFDLDLRGVPRTHGDGLGPDGAVPIILPVRVRERPIGDDGRRPANGIVGRGTRIMVRAQLGERAIAMDRGELHLFRGVVDVADHRGLPSDHALVQVDGHRDRREYPEDRDDHEQFNESEATPSARPIQVITMTYHIKLPIQHAGVSRHEREYHAESAIGVAHGAVIGYCQPVSAYNPRRADGYGH